MRSVKVSVIYSSCERSQYLRGALTFLTRQTMPSTEFEVIVIDDMSEEDYAPVLEEFRGKLHMQWLRIDHTNHPIYRALNPGGKPALPPENEPLWYHTPALTHNIGIQNARGEVLCITQPDILMKGDALELGHRLAKHRKIYVFGKPWMSRPSFRDWFFACLESGDVPDYDALKRRADHTGSEGVSLPEMYWWISFIKKQGAFDIGGVDEEYLRGVYGEDDDFRIRASRSGWAQKIHREIEGIHLNHEQFKGRWDRGHPRWLQGAEVNRARYRLIRTRPPIANQGQTWGSSSYVTKREVYEL